MAAGSTTLRRWSPASTSNSDPPLHCIHGLECHLVVTCNGTLPLLNQGCAASSNTTSTIQMILQVWPNNRDKLGCSNGYLHECQQQRRTYTCDNFTSDFWKPGKKSVTVRADWSKTTGWGIGWVWLVPFITPLASWLNLPKVSFQSGGEPNETWGTPATFRGKNFSCNSAFGGDASEEGG